MRAVAGIFKFLKPWQIGGLVGVAAVTTVAIYGVSTISGGYQPDSPPQPPEVSTAQQQPAVREIPVNGSLNFPQRAELTFDTSGEVGEILAQEGERVVQGQVLARLDDLSVSALEKELADARLNLDTAEEALQRAKKADFSDAPLEKAEYEDEVARARKALEDAERRLKDFQRDYQRDLAAAMRAKAAAENALDDAIRSLGQVDRDRVQDLANAIELVAAKELALEQARQKLSNFDANYDEALANALLKKANAEDALELAEDNLTEFKRNPVRDIENDKRIDVEALARLEAAVEEAKTNLQTAQDEQADLQRNRSLDRQEAEAAVPMIQAELIKARDDLAKLQGELDQALRLQMREANLEMAQANLALAESDLQEELDGPDQAELAVRQKEVALAAERLADIQDPDPFDVRVREAEVFAASARVDDALEELEGATIRAPFDGVISLVNLEVDDEVNDESRVLEIIDPSQVEVDGIIDAIDVQFVNEGGRARVTIASVPGQEFEGTVTRVAQNPRTERGVVSYPVLITIDLPPGVEVPVRLSPVSTIIIYREGDGS